MPSMLEQSIIDANALKEAALKNAEQAVVEKYSSKIKEAVDSILEQDEFDDLEDEDMGMDMGMEDDLGMEDAGEESLVADEIPLAAVDGEKLCPCPEDEEEIEIDFDELEQQMMSGDEEDAGALDREAFADDELEDDELSQVMEGLSGEMDESCEDKKKKKLEEGEEGEIEAQILKGKPPWADDEDEDDEDEDDELELNEEDLEKLAEDLRVDTEVVPNGWQGSNKAEDEYAQDVALAKLNDDKVKKELDSLKKTVKDLQENKKKQEKQSQKLLSENKKLKDFMNKFKLKLNEIQLVNAKLLYKNQTLINSSLNERQKKQIVEAITKADSVEQAKTIYETLKSTVESKKEKYELPKSLHEAIERRSSILRTQRRDTEKTTDSNAERWKKLAGIKGNP